MKWISKLIERYVIGTKSAVFLYILFLTTYGIIIMTPGFCYFYFGNGGGRFWVSAFVGLLVGMFAVSVLEFVFGATYKAVEYFKKKRS